MLKLWLVTFSNGEEWHIFGEYNQVQEAATAYEEHYTSITFIRAYRS